MEANVGCASIDLSLGNEFRIYKHTHVPVEIREGTRYQDVTYKIVVPEGGSFVLEPGMTCLGMPFLIYVRTDRGPTGITEEKIQLSPMLCGLLEGRSRFARLGLFVHITVCLSCGRC